MRINVFCAFTSPKILLLTLVNKKNTSELLPPHALTNLYPHVNPIVKMLSRCLQNFFKTLSTKSKWVLKIFLYINNAINMYY